MNIEHLHFVHAHSDLYAMPVQPGRKHLPIFLVVSCMCILPYAPIHLNLVLKKFNLLTSMLIILSVNTT